MRHQLIIGHRGASGLAPENTMAAFELAFELGADMIETDVQETIDGVLVCIHDYEVDRTTNGSGLVAELTYREIMKLDAGQGEKIPSLDEVLAFSRGKLKVNIELKIMDIEDRVLSLVRKHSMINDVLVSSFLHGTLIALRKFDRKINTAALVSHHQEDLISYISELEVNALNPHHELISPQLVQESHNQDLMIFPWTVNDELRIKELYQLEVDGIITDFPNIAHKIRKGN